MADKPRFGIRFQARDERASSDVATTTVGDKPGVPIYRRAVELAARAHQVIERADAERFFLRDQLDRKSSMIPQLIAQGLAVADMVARRQLFRHARRALTDCATIFDLLIERDSAPSDLVAAARAVTQAVLDELGELTVEPPRQW